MVVVFQGVGVDHVLKQVPWTFFAQHELVKIAKAQNKGSRAGIEDQSRARREPLIAHPFEQWQLVIDPFFSGNMPQYLLHRTDLSLSDYARSWSTTRYKRGLKSFLSS